MRITHMASLRLVAQPVGIAYSLLGHQYKRGYRAEKGRISPFISFGDDSKRSTSAHWVERLSRFTMLVKVPGKDTARR